MKIRNEPYTGVAAIVTFEYDGINGQVVRQRVVIPENWLWSAGGMANVFNAIRCAELGGEWVPGSSADVARPEDTCEDAWEFFRIVAIETAGDLRVIYPFWFGSYNPETATESPRTEPPSGGAAA